MAHGNVVGGQREEEQDEIAKILALDLALQDALSELVQSRGIEYLDIFLERRLRRTIEPMQMSLPGAPIQIIDMKKRQADAIEKALRDVIESVKRDPTLVI